MTLPKDQAEDQVNRLIDGICHVVPNKTKVIPRITTQYKEGSNGASDRGYSMLLKGTYISKASPAASVYGSQEKLQCSIAMCLQCADILEEEFITVLEWLREALFSYGAFCFSVGDSERHLIPTSFLTYMEKRIEYIKECCGPARDFLIHEDINLIYMDDVRVCVRDMESKYWAWFQTPEVQSNLIQRSHLEEGAQYMGKILNRLSAYLWQECRYQAHLQGNIETKMWISHCPSFPLEDKVA